MAATENVWRGLFKGNPLHWAALITLMTFAGMALGLQGLMISMPLLGHASWHAYRATVGN